MSGLVAIFVTFDLTEAICVRSFLDSRGIFTFLQNEHHITQSTGTLAAALGGYRLLVADADVQDARRLLQEAAAEKHSLAEDFDEGDVSLW